MKKEDLSKNDNICRECIEGEYFSEWIEQNGIEDNCDFCHAIIPTNSTSLENLIKEIDAYFRKNYSEGEIHYGSSIDSDNVEISHHGEPYEDILYEILSCNDSVLRFIIDNLPDCTEREIQQGSTPFYNSWTHYELNSDKKKRDSQDEIEYYHFIATSEVEDFKERLIKDMNSLKKLLTKLDPLPELSRLQLRMIFSSTITSLEAYLFDVFNKVFFSGYMDKSEIYEKYLISEFKDEQINFHDIYKISQELESRIKHDLYRKSFHNMKTAKKLYSNIFDIDLSHSKEYHKISNHIPRRHDFVHRGDKDKDGTIVTTNSKEIQGLMSSVELLCLHVNKQIKPIIENNINALF